MVAHLLLVERLHQAVPVEAVETAQHPRSLEHLLPTQVAVVVGLMIA